MASTTNHKLIYIHGGMTFKAHNDYIHYLQTRSVSLKKRIDWSDEFLDIHLGSQVQIVRLYMPCKDNAKYEDWKIHFERYIPFIDNKTILVGKSLGGIFLAKYLSENILPFKALSVYLLCPPYDNTLPGEDLVGGFDLGTDLLGIENNASHTYALFSQDDPVIPSSHIEKYRTKLSATTFVVYEGGKGHFWMPEFPEIIELIKYDITNL